MPFGPRELVDLDCDLSQLIKIPGRPGHYINRSGDVFAVRKLSPFVDEDGYTRINSGKFKAAVHRLLAIVFLGKPKPGQTEVRHLDGNPRNNHLDNLAWGTRSENAADMALHGSVRGSRNSRAILTDEAVREIKATTPGNGAIARLAVKFSVCYGTIKAVRSGRNWGHVRS